VELEATIRTLQRKICLLEKESPTEVLNSGPPGVNVASDSQRNGPGGHFDHSQTNMSGRFEDPVTKMNCELMKGIHRQVTSFVLTKVAQQLSCLESYTGMMQNQQQFTGHNMNVHNPNTDAMNTATPLLNPIFNPSFNQTLYRQANPTFTSNFNQQHVNQRKSADNQYYTGQQERTMGQCNQSNGQYTVSKESQGHISQQQLMEAMSFHSKPDQPIQQTSNLTTVNSYSQQQPGGQYQLGTIMQNDNPIHTSVPVNENGSSNKYNPLARPAGEQQQGWSAKNPPRHDGLGSHGRSAARGITPRSASSVVIREASGISHKPCNTFRTEQQGNGNEVLQVSGRTTQSSKADIVSQSTERLQAQNHRQQHDATQSSIDCLKLRNPRGGPFTAEGDPVFYDDSSRGARHSCPDQSFLYQTKPRRGRL
ncbi:MAG: hypothetical protein N0E48_20540, partial [Candidatus Thiodiazotropha endolucinida]|nr:hypothetical protein [Candidatus Thiodiazotropha taylori]MCW4345722.1 hypothetical protein [Candidatus Thiodiazotropha endolucinida]